MKLNGDVVECIALGHDLGHGPFGHAGEWALEELMKEHGGFEHNVQTLRIVEKLEESYAAFPGLNLSFETLEGLKKHPEKFYGRKRPHFRTLEADLVDIADEIAYNSHDLDDGLRAELITEDQIIGLALWKDALSYIKRKYPSIGTIHRRRLGIRLIINRLVTDLVGHTTAQIKRYDIGSLESLQGIDKPIMGFSQEMARMHREIKAFLHKNLYRHYRVVRMTDKGQRFIKALFRVFLEKPEQLPPDVQKRVGKEKLHRVICDYIAGMTDRFALDEYKRFFEPYERV